MTAAAEAPGDLLRCPRCELIHGPDERFCRDCGMPLVVVAAGGADVESLETAEAGEAYGLPGAGGVSRAEAAAYARRIRPQLARGELVRVAGARNLAEAELIQGMLIDQGVPSILRRTRGFDVPDFIAAGPRDVMVPESGVERARELLSEADLLGPGASGFAAPAGMPGVGSPARLAFWLGASLVGAFALVWVLYQLTG